MDTNWTAERPMPTTTTTTGLTIAAAASALILSGWAIATMSDADA